jgi:HlyD family secretion protein
MEPQLGNLKIDRSQKRSTEPSPWATRFIIVGITLFVLVGVGALTWNRLNAAATEVETVRVHAMTTGGASSDPVILNATGYIIAAHTIDVAAKVDGKVQWIGVDKGDHVNLGQVLVRLEDDEYRARVLEAQGALDNLKAHLTELENGSRPEEIAKAKADVEQAKADEDDARVTLRRTQELVKQGVFPRQQLDDAQAKYDDAASRVSSLQRTYDLEKLGPRHEEIDAARAQVKQAQGTLDYAKTQLDDTIITAPVTGTILDRNVEKGEFVTTGFVGDKGAKGYVVSLADLNDLQVELDINQNDFAKLGARTRGIVTTDAYPDRRYDGVIQQISPEANRQKATVQVKVQVLHPDSYLRPEMNATVAFLGDEKTSGGAPSRAMVVIPASAVRDNAVFVVSEDNKAVRRAVKLGGTNAQGVVIENGLIGGEDVVVNPPAELKDGQKVRVKA